MDLDQQLERAMYEITGTITPQTHDQWESLNLFQRRQVARTILSDEIRETATVPLGSLDNASLPELLALRESFRRRPPPKDDDGGWRSLRESGIPSQRPAHQIVARLHDALPVDHEDADRVSQLHRRGAALDTGERDEARMLGAKHVSLLDEAEPGTGEEDGRDTESGLNGISVPDDQPVLLGPEGSLSKESDGGRGYLHAQGIPTRGDELEPMPERGEVSWETAMAERNIPTKAT